MSALFTEKTKNDKIRSKRKKAEVCTTYASIKGSCPKTCTLKETQECYGMHGHVGLVTRRLDKKVTRHQPLKTAKAEAAAIDNSFKGRQIPQDGAQGGRDLRLHTVGDAATPKAARTISAAVARFYARGGGTAWSYTHAWKDVDRENWGDVSILASIDKVEDATMAVQAGYAPARYVAEFESDKAWSEAGVSWVPCPAQTKENIGCADCRLCLNADSLHKRGMGIAFSAHGVKAKSMKRRLTVV